MLRRCHDDGTTVNEATELLWRRQLRRTENIMSEETISSGEGGNEENDATEYE